MDRIESVIGAARDYGAESVRRLGDGVVHVSFRRFERSREIGYLEVRVDVNAPVRVLDYRQSAGPAGQRWAAHVSNWVVRASDAIAADARMRVASDQGTLCN